jgi:hypothetical protein
MALKMKKGKYQVRVVNFDGSAEGHKQVWKMRSFGAEADVKMTHQNNYVYKSG